MPASVTSAKSLSVVVPAYNEEAYIGPCLAALVAQSNHIHEIIVVNNNSTDRTVAVVEAFMQSNPKVKLISEGAPGVAHARNTGFRAATGDILGRVDADTRVKPGWARAVLDYFSADGAHVGGVTGLNEPYDSPVRGLKAWWFGRHVKKGTIGGGREVTNLHGANMAIRRAAWRRVEPLLSTDAELHEDLDLALCLGKIDVKLAQLTDMNVELSPRRALTPPSEFGEYIECGIRTFERHDAMNDQRRTALRLHWWWHILVFAVYRPYDPRKKRFSIRYLLSPVQSRVLPVSAEATRVSIEDAVAQAS
nr:glycosyltransferase family 2 protein [Rhodococcus sp. (in: high G+C Gram-positive bacteria)]